MKFYTNKKQGFTLIEVLVVIGIIAILAGVVLVAVNPSRQFAQARNSQRTSNVAAIINAIGQNAVDNHGLFTCSGVSIPENAAEISSTGINIRSCIVPNYLTEIPIDPTQGNIAESSYNTGYTIVQDPQTHRITVNAPHAELDQTISISR